MTQAQVALLPLMDHCEVITDVPLTKEGSRRPCGGQLSVS